MFKIKWSTNKTALKDTPQIKAAYIQNEQLHRTAKFFSKDKLPRIPLLATTDRLTSSSNLVHGIASVLWCQIQGAQKIPLHLPEAVVGRYIFLLHGESLTVGKQICWEIVKVLNHVPHVTSDTRKALYARWWNQKQKNLFACFTKTVVLQ